MYDLYGQHAIFGHFPLNQPIVYVDYSIILQRY